MAGTATPSWDRRRCCCCVSEARRVAVAGLPLLADGLALIPVREGLDRSADCGCWGLMTVSIACADQFSIVIVNSSFAYLRKCPHDSHTQHGGSRLLHIIITTLRP